MERLDDPAAVLSRPGLLERLSGWFSEAVGSVDVEARIVAAVEHIINLIVGCVLQTILLPLAFIWAAPRVAVWLVRLRR